MMVVLFLDIKMPVDIFVIWNSLLKRLNLFSEQVRVKQNSVLKV